MNTPDPLPEIPPRSHEGADIDPGLIARIAVIFVLGIVASLVAAALLFGYFHRIYPDRTSEAAPQVSESDLPPLPRVQTTPARDLQEVLAAENLHLSRYAWINRQQGMAQIPIERAMTLWVQLHGATAAAPVVNGVVPGTTELQMRQDKAKESAHAP